jgi:hypothetical protein
MATAVKRKLTGSTDGRGIGITAIGSLGNVIHTAVVGTTPGTFDEIWLYAHNVSTSSVAMTLQFGSSSASDNVILTVPSQTGKQLIVAGEILQNSSSVYAYATTASCIVIGGFVNSMTD